MAKMPNIDFIKTSASPLFWEMILMGEVQYDNLEEMVADITRYGWKVSISYSFDRASFILSMTTTKDHLHPHKCISLWSGSIDSCFRKASAVLRRIGGPTGDPTSLSAVKDSLDAYLMSLVSEEDVKSILDSHS